MSENIPVRQQSRTKQTKEKIRKEYISLIRVKNWEKITVKELCERVNVSRGTFYQHFDGIYDVMEQIQTGLLSALEERLQASKPVPVANRIKLINDFEHWFDMSVPALFNIWYSFCEEHREELLSLCHMDNGDLCFPVRVRALLHPHLDAMMDRDGLPRDGYREHFHIYFFNLLYYVMYSWLKGESHIDMSCEMMADAVNVTRIGACYSYYKRRAEENE